MTIPPVPPPPGSYPPPGDAYPKPGSYPPPPTGNYPPPPPGSFPPPAPGAYYPGAPSGALPKEAYTSWITRVAAYFIDLVPAAAIAGIGQGVMFATGKNECTTDSSDLGYGVYCTSIPSPLGLVVGLVFGLAALAFVIWNHGYRQGTTGSSIGKSVMKFKVVGEATGQPIGFGMSIVRQLAHILDTLICYIGYLFPLWDAKRQTIADKVMSTVCLPL